METAFRQVFGASPLVRVLDFFLDNQEFAYSMADVIREEGISFMTIKPVWDRLVAVGVLKEVDKRRKASLYVLDFTHPFVRQLLVLDNTLIESGIVA